MKKIISALILSAMLLTACGGDNSDEDKIVVSEIPAAKAYISGGGTTVQATEAPVVYEPEETIATFAEDEIAKDDSFDINACGNAPLLSGDTRELDWSMVFDNGCISICGETFPAYMKVNEFGSDFALEIVDVGSVNSFNPKELNDYYILHYHGYEVCGVITARKANVAPDDAYVSGWTMGGFEDTPKEKLGLMGFSVMQDAAEVAGIYPPDEKDGDTIKYYGVTESDGERLACSLSHNKDFATMLTITPYEINPDAYKAYSDK